MDRLLKILREYDGLEYKLVEKKSVRAEGYYVRDELEQNRSVDVTHTELTVYKSFEDNGKQFKGSATTELFSSHSDAEIRECIENALFSAGFVYNESYPLVAPSETKEPVPNEINKEDMFKAIDALKTAMYAHDTYKDGHLSYSEFFIEKNILRIVNSLGLDITTANDSIYVETAINWLKSEISESFRFADLDADKLASRIKTLFTVASEKPNATKTPAVKDINILLRGEALRDFFGYYYANANAAQVYNRLSTFKLGESVQGDDIKGDRITLTLDPMLPGSTHSMGFDKDGFALAKTTIIEDGKLLRYWGDLRNSHYMGVEPTGDIKNFIISGGTKTEAELKGEPYLELFSFSSFQGNPSTGDFGSEIRLGFYYDGETVRPVTSGSIMGNIKKVQENLYMTAESEQFNNFVGPRLICIRDVIIAGEAL